MRPDSSRKTNDLRRYKLYEQQMIIPRSTIWLHKAAACRSLQSFALVFDVLALILGLVVGLDIGLSLWRGLEITFCSFS